MFTVLFVWLSTAFGQVAAPSIPITVKVRATVSDDLRTIQGTLSAEDHAGLEWHDLLSKLPVPTSDRVQQRTFTHIAETGFVKFENPVPEGRAPVFHTVLPRRMGASGFVPGRGLFLNGLWHPQPVANGRSALVTWDVEVSIPNNTVGVLNGAVGETKLSWKGTADRLSLAVIPHGRVQRQAISPSASLTLVDRGMGRQLRDLRLMAIAMTGLDNEASTSFVVVETPNRRRLTRIGPNTLFLSDRAFRVSGRQWKNHLPAVRRGMQAASLSISDPWIRDLIASLTPAEKYQTESLWKSLRWRAFLPRVDSLLYDGRSAFMSEVFEETWPSDPVRDDLIELLDNPTPAVAAAKKLEHLYGQESMRTWATAVIAGAHPDDAAIITELPSNALRDWYAFPPPQDVSVDVARESSGWKIRIERTADPSAPHESIPFRLDGEDKMWTSTSHIDQLEIARTQKPSKVHVDPKKEVLQTDRSNDTWPKPQTFTVAGTFSEINTDRFRPNAALYLVRRRPYASRWMHGVVANTNAIERMGGGYSLGYGFGSLLDRRNYVWRAWTGPSLTWLDPDFDPKQPGGTAVDWSLGVRKDTRDSWPIARHGHRLSIYGGGGLVLGQEQQWLSSGTSASVLAPIGGTVVSANRIKLDATTASLTHRQLGLGGASAVQGLPSGQVRGRRRAIASSELRFIPVRHASIPLWLAWVTHVQISGSMDAGWVDGSAAVGWSTGIAFAADLFGRESAMLGLWAASPIWQHSVPKRDAVRPQLYLRATQTF